MDCSPLPLLLILTLKLLYIWPEGTILSLIRCPFHKSTSLKYFGRWAVVLYFLVQGVPSSFCTFPALTLNPQAISSRTLFQWEVLFRKEDL